VPKSASVPQAQGVVETILHQRASLQDVAEVINSNHLQVVAVHPNLATKFPDNSPTLSMEDLAIDPNVRQKRKREMSTSASLKMMVARQKIPIINPNMSDTTMRL